MAEETRDILEIKSLSGGYGKVPILHGIDFSVGENEVVGILGHNGMGKTTLLKTAMGFLPAGTGNLRFHGTDITRMSPYERAGLGLGYVPQGRFIFPMLTVRENLQTGFGCLPAGEKFVPDEIYELFPVLKTMLDRRGGDLSGGQQQQLAIARALITKPKLLLLDEPTEGIQPNIISQIGEVIGYLRAQQTMAIVLVEQYFDFAFGLADQIFAMMRGQIVYESPTATIDKARLRQSVGV